jgi:phosphopantothenoylcysteine decarboxylase/phosphopantothenate--cysteine ligase
MPTQPHLLLLQKSMVMEEGVATALDPDINMWETAEPFLKEWIRSELGPEAYYADRIIEVVRAVKKIPELIDRIDDYYPPRGAAPPAPPLPDIAIIERQAWWGYAAARLLLIVGGGIAAYKSLELVRLLKKAGHDVTPVLTKGGEHFVTAMSLGTLAESQVHTSLWELKDEVEIGHIQLSRAADLVLVCPATADLLAKMAAGIADDLATTLLLATDKPVVVAPAMNVRMWLHAATQRNIAQLKADGVRVIDPAEGDMACGEFGPGRLPEPQEIVDQLSDLLA